MHDQGDPRIDGTLSRWCANASLAVNATDNILLYWEGLGPAFTYQPLLEASSPSAVSPSSAPPLRPLSTAMQGAAVVRQHLQACAARVMTHCTRRVLRTTSALVMTH